MYYTTEGSGLEFGLLNHCGFFEEVYFHIEPIFISQQSHRIYEIRLVALLFSYFLRVPVEMGIA